MTDSVDSLRRDVDRHENSIRNISDSVTSLMSSNKLLEQAIMIFSENHTGLLARFDKFADDYKNHGYILETYMENVQSMRKTLQEFVETVQKIELKNDLVLEKRLDAIEEKHKELEKKIDAEPSSLKDHITQYRYRYIVGAAITGGFILINLPPEVWPHIIEAFKIFNNSKSFP